MHPTVRRKTIFDKHSKAMECEREIEIESGRASRAT
jgi:hypothetical protein